jgi:4'-phosphopantetheinyl transferase
VTASDVERLTLRHGVTERPAYLAVVTGAMLQTPAYAPDLVLSERELAHHQELRFVQKREAFLLGRCAAKQALAALLNEAVWSTIDVHSGVFGQPLVRHARALGVDVTLSHSNDTAVALAYPAEWPMGIDLETVEEVVAATVLAEMEPSAEEQAWVRSSGLSQAAACAVLWGAREALGKALKTGLNSPLRLFALSGLVQAEPGVWTGGYANFPRFAWRATQSGARTLSLAFPAGVEFASWPALCG